MRKRVVVCVLASLLVLAGGAWSQTNPDPSVPANVKVGIINIQRAIAESAEGKKAAEELTKRFTPKRSELQKKQEEVARLQKQLEDGKNIQSDEMRANLARDLERKTKEFNRDNEDANTDFQQAEAQVINTIGQKVMQVIDEYARKRTYDVILDVSSPQSNVLWATNRIDITDDIIAQYNATHPGEGGPSASGAAGSSGGANKAVAKPAAPAPRTTPAAKPEASKPPAPKAMPSPR